MQEKVIYIHRDAPPKPPEGAPCNGCGVCCALNTCPVARLRFLQINGPCPALLWSDEHQRYQCSLLLHPRDYLGYLPASAAPLASRLFARWIAAGKGCDCSAAPDSAEPDKFKT